MSRNIGVAEKALRIAAGVTLLGLTSVEVIGPWGYAGFVPLLTGLVRWCPLYAAFGLNPRYRRSAVHPTVRVH